MPFVVTSGGLFSPTALRLLRQWAHHHAGSGEDNGPHGSASQSFRRHGIRLLSTFLHRWNAFHIHEAAAELAEQLSTREDTLRSLSVTPILAQWHSATLASPELVELLTPSQELDLADIDVAGLASAASMSA